MLKNECSGFQAPDGWKFQKCKDPDEILLLRTRDVGDWEMISDDTFPKDNYQMAISFGDPKNPDWEVSGYSMGSGTGGGLRFHKRKDAIAEMICFAKGDDVWDEEPSQDRAKRSIKVLKQCESEFGIYPYYP